ncbi:SDR family NAD(P)-dependent oxidoreductase [Saccharothrix obliqua]|uniref:SDR family NAD(P)-dependent oxidoreductase n=1 Tax=Saccharothrix obliqua TaxID=2861747 RepID=UPI0027E34B6F|nr:SDR family NAD(P)-dependent oxidoreductase [Saccharothrix obliqua]
MTGFECRVVLSHDDFVMRNHRLHGVSVMPGVVFFDLVYRAAMAAGWDPARLVVRDTVLAEAIVTTEGHDREIVLAVGEENGAGRPFTVRSRWLRGGEPVSDWHDNAHGLVCLTDDPLPPALDPAAVRAAATRREDVASLYRRAVREGIEHGAPMKCEGVLHLGGGALLAELTRAVEDPAHAFHLHPASLDATTLAGFGQLAMPTDDPFVPMFVRELRAPQPLPAQCLVHVSQPERLAASGDVVTTDYTVHDADGRFLASFTGLTCKRIREPGLVRRLLDDVTPPPTDDLADRVRDLVAAALGRPVAQVATDVGFYDLGLDSVALLGLTGELEELVGEQLYPTLLFEHSTIDALTAHLSAHHVARGTALTFVDDWVPSPANHAHQGAFTVVADGPVPGLSAVRELPTGPGPVVLVSDDPAAALWRAASALVDAGPRDLLVVTSAPLTPERAGTGALARTISAEVPGLHCRFAHVDRPGDVAAAVRAELAHDPEPEVRYRAGRRYVRRWHEVAVDRSARPLRDEGVYLVTGGSGGLARLLAEHLAERHHARIALLSRTAPDPALVEACERAGGQVHVVTADVTDAEQVRRAVDAVRAEFGRVDGVFHCAGVRRDGLFFRGSPDDLAAVAAPKLDGLRNLVAATAGDEPDFLAVFSSASASVANPGQAAYAYANACVEHVEGRVVVIGWPLWADGGMTVSEDVVRRSGEATGQTPMPARQGLALLPAALAAPHRSLVVLHGVAERIRTLLPIADTPEAEPVVPDDDAIAVIGMAGRYPGADDLDEFWRNLAAGADCVTEVPADRWDHAALFDPAKGVPGRTYGKWGGFLNGVDRFAPAFFGISRRDAERMDPQERLFLTTCLRTLENAGYAPESLGGEVVGVYAGTMWNHYQLVDGAEDGVAPHAMHCSIANRVSHAFDLTGPSMAVDTACSSSLTAVHLAVESIRRGECTMALAGGVNVTVHPQKYLQLAQGQWLSVDGRCRAFGRDGTGYVPGEGVGAVLLKRLDRALADGDHVHGVIRATALNHTGRTAGATVPSPGSQAALIRRALGAAGWDPSTVGYVEAHGTGTSLGDPIEVEGLRQAFDGTPLPAGSCAIGSVKSSVGHLEGAAGVAGLTKVLLQLRHRALVPSLHAEELNPHIDFAATPFRVQRVLEPWRGTPLRAGVSAFGAGGTNAHVLVEEYVPAPREVSREPALVVLSARTAEELRDYAAALAAGLPSGSAIDAVAGLLGVAVSEVDSSATVGDLGLEWSDLVELFGADALTGVTDNTPVGDLAVDVPIGDIAYTTQVGRTAMAVRMAVVASGSVALRAALTAYARGAESPDVVVEGVPVGDPVVAFHAGDLHAVARHWVGGGDVAWADCHLGERPHRVPLPGYPLREERCWLGGWAARSAPAPVAGEEYEFRLLEHGIALVTMRSTMFTPGLLDGLKAVFGEIERRDDVRAVVVTGSGSVFSMGGTPEALETLAEGAGTFTDASFIYDGLLKCTRPVVVAAAGHASGGGLAFACYGDVVVLGEESVYSANFAKYGFTPGMGATYVLEQRFGAALAKEMLLTGRSLTGEELRRRGVNVTVLPRDEVLPAALDLARSMADRPASVIRVLKDELAGRVLRDLPEIIASEVRMHRQVLGDESAAMVREHFAKVQGFRDAAPTAVPMDAAPTSVEPAGAAPIGAALTGAAPTSVEPAGAAPTGPAPTGAAPVVDGVADQGRVADDIGAAIREVLGGLLYLEPHEVVADRSFSDLGLDSIGAVELVRDLNRRFGTELDSVAVYDHPTLPDLVGAVRSAMGERAALRRQATSPRPEPARVSLPAVHAVVPETPAETPVTTPPAGPPDLVLTIESREASVSSAARSPAPAEAVGRDASTRIAVIGMAGRFPDAPDLDAFWRNLAAGVSSIREVPAERWDLTSLYDPDPARTGTTRSRWAALLDDVDAFDAALFRISPLEAEAMDPQQRLFLEQAWAALEDAGYGGRAMRCGVFVGCASGDYTRLLDAAGVGTTSEAFLGTASSILPARIAYQLDLTGPTMAVDTACSSSLTAVHLACESILSGECDTALAGGVAVMCTPRMQVWTSQTGMLSPAGRCLPFDEAADGIVLGEGVGAVLLKRLDRALADGDHVHGVILASGVNGDGRTNGITAPSATSQAALLREVHAKAGVPVSYVEAHGTGTNLGDPIEVKALRQVVSPECALGSVKANIGHTTMSAGIAGLLKVLLALRHRQLPPTPNVRNPIPGLPVVRELTPWVGDRLAAGVSSFGFSGTNCHVVVGEAPVREAGNAVGAAVVPVSARTATALRAQVDRLATHLKTADVALHDVATTLSSGRAHLAARAAFVAEDLADLVRQLENGATPGTTARHDLARRWESGEDVDWPTGGRRVPLPTYPFARDRFWVGGPRLDPSDPVVADHVVAGVPTLPGALFLRRATGHAPRVTGVTWLRPVPVTGPVTVSLGTEGRLELTAGGAVHAVAEARPAPAAESPLDLAAVEARCTRHIAGDTLYEAFHRAGLRYGPTFRVLTDVVVGDGEALATLHARPGDDVQVLDGAMQAIASLLTEASRPLLPFAIDSAHADRDLPSSARVHVTRRDTHRFDVVLTDLSGVIKARLDGVALRPAADRQSLLYKPVWRPTAAPDARPAGRTLVVHTAADAGLAAALRPDVALRLGELPEGRFDTVYVLARPDDPARPAEDDASVRHAFRLVRHLVDAGAGRVPLTLVFVVPGTQAVDGGPVHPHAAGLVGLAGAIAGEYPEWSVTCVDVGVDDPAGYADAIRREHGADLLVAVRGDRRLVRVLEPLPASDAPVPLRDGGVYVVLGGAGGLGVEVTRHLVRTRGARVAWLGRSPEDARIRGLVGEFGEHVRYFQADAGDAEAVRHALAAVRQAFGPVDGAIHSAITLRDRSLATMSEDDLLAVLRPKVAGLAAFAAALREEPLDFLAVFSSALAFTPAPGQGNYAAATAFEDSYALALHRSGVPVKLVNWGFWGSVGVVARADYAARFAALGIGSIEPAEGVAALEQALAGTHPQVAVLKGDPDGLARLGVRAAGPGARDAGGSVALGGDGSAGLGARSAGGSVALSADAGGSAGEREADGLARSRAGFAALDGLARDLLRATPIGTGDTPLHAAVRAAAATPAAGLSAADVLARHPDLAPHVELLTRCVSALPDVLAGRTRPTEVLFPGGSAELVGAVYRGQEAADFHHRLMADELARVAGPSARVLEVGAGTGAGSAFALAAAGGAHYDYTDVSTAFLRSGEEAFGARFPNTAFRVLDIEQDPVAQGFEPGSYDAVLATNVLHATADIVAVLRNTRALLKPGGVLLVNEVTRSSDFLTATFGLLPGWWRFTDGHRRLPHSPLLSPAGWRSALAEAGMSVRVLGMPGGPDEQCVLVATAGATVRDYVRRVFAEVLKYRPADLDDSVTFDNFGVDSLVGQRIVRRFEADLGDLPATLLFEHLTIEQLAAHFAARHADAIGTLTIPTPAMPGSASAPPAPATPAPAIPAAIPTPTRSTTEVRPPVDGIAVVGLAGRYPGARDLDEFWHNLVAGVTSITEVPADRWDWREHFDPRKGKPQHTYGRWGGFLTDVDRFDPAFFGILPKDAAAMDPQERLFLETAWLLLEDSGHLGSGHVRDTGVFVGTMYGSYGRIAAATGWPRGRFTDGHSSYWSIANRVSYALDLTGPSFAVDSACSSSLTAVHLACESIRRGECSMAIAGGVNLVLHPAHLIALSSMTMLAGDGACKVFDERADGFVPGEGVGAVLLKPLADALRDGDHIRAVIEGTALNAGGKTGGYTVPNPTAQAELVTRALASAGVEPGGVGYIEAHGTGTALGDPIEIAGLAKALGDDARCAVGSVKANIGHLEGAAGIAGLTKVLLQLEHGTIAPCASLDTVNPRIDLPPGFTLPTEAVPWTAPRRAGVSSFGAGGANAHVVLSGYENPAAPEVDAVGRHAVLLSARTPDELHALATAVADHVERHAPGLPALAWTTQVGRAELPHRLAVVVSDLAELCASLRGDGGHRAAIGDEYPGRELFAEDGGLVTDLLARRDLDRLAAVWVHGIAVDWRRLWSVRPRRVSLPPYPFTRQRLWLPGTDVVERPWLTEHLVAGRRVLPGAAALEEVCAGDACTLSDVRWPAPLHLDSGPEPVTVVSGGRFTVTSGALTIAEGRCTTAVPQPETLDLDAVRTRCSDTVEPDDLYAAMRAAGLAHGAGMRVLREVRVGEREVLARITADHRVLALDGAFQALAALPGPDRVQLPVGFATLTRTGTLPTEMWAHAVETAAPSGERRFDLRVAAADGRVLLAVDGLRVVTADEDPCTYLRPEWVPAPLAVTGPATPDPVVLRLPATSDGLADEIDRSLHAVLRTAVDRLTEDPGALLRIVVVCPDARPAYAAAAAALRTLALEHSGFSGVVVHGGEPHPDELRHVTGAPEARVSEVRYVDGVRQERRMVGFRPAAGRPARTGGVYLVVGGTGVIGEHVAAHLRATRAPRAVVVTGRADADVTVASDVRRLVDDVKATHGRIDGVVFAAGVHDDQRAVAKTAERVNAVLAPKTLGVRNLLAALGDDELEFFVLFSSVAARTGNLGQADYAYANAFLDESAATTPSLVSVCWPLWADGGMVVDDQTRRLFARRWGSEPLGTADALRAFDRLATGSEPVVAVVRPVTGAATGDPATGSDPVVVRPAAEAATADVGAPVDVDAELRVLAAGFLLVEPEEVDPDLALLDLGFDSISLTGLTNEVNERFGLDLLPTVFYERPTLTSFAEHLRDLVPTERPGVAVDRVADAPVDDAVAVIGMAGVLPGSPDLDAFWQHLVAGDDLVRPVPEDRTDLRGDPAVSGVRAGFLDDVRSFDARRFGISPREAALMDPQQRLFLQTAWQAVADAGYRPDDLAGTDTGLFVGVSACDYDDLLHAHNVPVEAHTASGLADCILANRVSYLFDLRGPSEAIDTACSSSLVAVHRAVRALRAGECSVALAGGVNVLLSPGLFVAFQSSGMLSADGRCRTFDDAADGYGRGEGCGVVLLKPLSAALADGDQVIGVIRGSAVNHAGRGPSLTAPNPEAQARVIARAYETSGVDPARVSYIEAHGTGTRLGDPIEVEGLKKAFGGVDARIGLGAVKTNIGHLEAAAGIAGLLKVLLAMRHGELPPTLHQRTPNPYVRLAGTPFRVVAERAPWVGDRVAGVSSFGFGGTNAHVVVQSAPEMPVGGGIGPWRLVLSADSAGALAEYRTRVARHLAVDRDLDRLCFTLQTGREALGHRFAAVVADRAEAVAVLTGDAEPRLDEDTAAWLAGADVDWAARWPTPPVRVSAPVPPFAATPFWFDQLAPAGRKLVLRDPRSARGSSVPVAPVVDVVPVVAVEEPVTIVDGSVEQVIRESVAKILGTDVDAVAADTAFSDLGLDSIFRMELARSLMAAFDVELTAAQLYEHDTVAALAALIGGTAPVSERSPVAEIVEEALERPLDESLSFADNGLTSFDMLRAIAALESRYGALPKTLLFDRPTMAELTGFLAGRDTREARPAVRGARDIESAALVTGRPAVFRKRRLPDHPELGALVADLDRRYAKEGGLAGRDIAPYAFLDTAREGYVNFSVRGDDLFAWSFVGDHAHFHDLVADWMAWARRAGLRPNFLSLIHLTEVAGEPVTATPFGAVQRLDDLSAFTTSGGAMSRLRYLLGRFERAGAVRCEEYRVGDDPATDHRIVGLMDSWGDHKQMVNPYVGVVREEIRTGRLDPRHRMFLTHVDDELVNAIIVTRIPSEQGYLLDLEFYPDSMPAGGLEHAIVEIIRRTAAEGCTSFSFGASFGVAITESPNADPEVAAAIEELHSIGVFGSGNFQFKNKFRTANTPIYLCGPATGDRTSVTDIILMIANPELTGGRGADEGVVTARGGEERGGEERGATAPTGLGGTPPAAPAPAEPTRPGGTSPGTKAAAAQLHPAHSSAEPPAPVRTSTAPPTAAASRRPVSGAPSPATATPQAPVPTAGATPQGSAPTAGATPQAPVPTAGATPQAPVPTAAGTQVRDGASDITTTAGRGAVLAGHGHNALTIPTELVPVDLLTDSWAERVDGFVAERARHLTGLPRPDLGSHDWLPFTDVLPTRSGRSAEALVCRNFPGPRGTVVHTAVFPTWLLSLTDVGFEPVAVGDGRRLDPTAVARAVDDRTSFVVVEASNNAGGGLPLGLDELAEVRRITRERGVPLVLDASRLLENALALDPDDPWSAARQLLSSVDTATFSLSKDFGVAAGGLVATRDPELAARLHEDVRRRGWDVDRSTRDLIAAAVADRDGVTALVRTRVAAVAELARGLRDRGVPVVDPVGGHCVLVDVDRLPAFADQEHAVMSFLAWLYLGAGVRGAPHLSAGSRAVRLAVPAGFSPADAAAIADRVAELVAGDTPAVELVTGGVRTPGEAARAVYQPVERVPEDVRHALRDERKPSDDNEAVLREHCPDVRRTLVSVDGVDVEVFTAGEGAPVLLMHPFNIGAGVFAHQFAGLSRTNLVISAHHPGVGGTTAAPDITLPGLAALERDALRELGVEGPVHVVGASFGGLVALTYALEFPSGTASLALLGSSYKIGNRVGEINRLAVVAAEDLDRTIEGGGSNRLKRERAAVEATLLRCESMDPQIGLRYLDVFAARPDLLHRLGDVSVPTLVVQGRHDTVIPLKTAHLLHGAIPGARYAEISDAGHFPYLTSPSRCNRVLSAFIAEHVAPEVVR